MSISENLSNQFSSEDRKRGEDLYAKDSVQISSASDTGARAFVRASSGIRVALTAADVGSASLTAECSCPSSAKGHLCKHVWAVPLKLEEKGSDFLEGKREIEILSGVSPAKAESQQRQADFRKQRYQEQKTRAKQQRRDKKAALSSADTISYPDDVSAARSYFVTNGFPMTALDMDELMNAKRLLSRVFHPDKGGTHEETVELNRHFEVIRDYLKA